MPHSRRDASKIAGYRSQLPASLALVKTKACVTTAICRGIVHPWPVHNHQLLLCVVKEPSVRGGANELLQMTAIVPTPQRPESARGRRRPLP